MVRYSGTNYPQHTVRCCMSGSCAHHHRGANLSPTKISLDPEKTEEGEYIAQKPTISVLTHASLLTSNDVLERVVKRLNSAGKLDEDFVLEDLFEKLEVENTEQTNVLQLLAKDATPGLARDIANIWAEEYTGYSLEIVEGEVFGSGTFVEDQFEVVKDELEKAEQAAI